MTATIIMEKILRLLDPAMNGQSLFVVGFDGQNPWHATVDPITPHDILLLTQGFQQQIIATPHIGRHWASNSAYPLAGVKIYDFTGNMADADKEDQPEFATFNGETIRVTDQKRVLSPYLEIRKNVLIVRQHAQLYVSSAHHRAKKKLFPEAIHLDTELYAHSVAEKVIGVLWKNQEYLLQGYEQSIFPRWVEADGTVRHVRVDDTATPANLFRLKESHNEMILHDSKRSEEGPLVIKEVLILLDVVRQIYDSGLINRRVADVYHVSGISMLSYCKDKSLRAVLDRGYKILRRNFPELPEHVRLSLLPGSLFGMLPTKMDPADYVNAIREALRLKAEINRLDASISSNRVGRDGLIAEKKTKRFALMNTLGKAKKVTRPLVSQYDGDRARVDDEAWELVQELSFRDLREMAKKL